jgi:malate dehydrogenase
MADLSIEFLLIIQYRWRFYTQGFGFTIVKAVEYTISLIEYWRNNMKVTVIGAAGGIGQALSLLLKNGLPAGSELALFDLAPVTPGVAVDLSHIPTDVKITGFSKDDLSQALTGADVVMIPAGMPRKPGMDRADLFNANAGIIKGLAQNIVEHCPKAMVGVITNPVNTTVPIVAEVFKKAGTFDARRLFGVTTLDVIRSETFVAELKGLNAANITVPVIGGHSGTTILPLLSQIDGVDFTAEEVRSLTVRIQNAGTEVVEAKAGGGSATLSMGQAAARFCLSLVNAMNGEAVVEYAYVEGNGEYAPFFAQPMRLGPNGVEALLPIGDLSAYEEKALGDMMDTLKGDVKKGIDFINA